MSQQVFINIPRQVQDALDPPPDINHNATDVKIDIPDLETTSSLARWRERQRPNHGLGHALAHNLDNVLVTAAFVAEDPVAAVDFMRQPVPRTDAVEMEEYDAESNQWIPMRSNATEPRWRRTAREAREMLRQQRSFNYPKLEEKPRKYRKLNAPAPLNPPRKSPSYRPFSLTYPYTRRHYNKYRRSINNVLYF